MNENNIITFYKWKFNIQKHHNSHWQTPWSFTQWGFIFFALLPTLAAASLMIALIHIWQKDYRKLVKKSLSQAWGILVLLLIISAAVAQDQGAAFLGLLNFLPFIVFFIAFSAIMQTPKQLRRLALILVITSIPVIILGIGQIFWGWSGPFSLHWLLGWALEATGNPKATANSLGRMASVFMYANILSGYLLMIFPLALALWLEEWLGGGTDVQAEKAVPPPSSNSDDSDPRLVRRNTQVSRERRSPLALLTFAIIGIIIGLIFTNARSAWGISAITVVVFAIYLGWRWLSFFVLAPTGAILLAAFGPGGIKTVFRKLVPSFFWARLTDEMFTNRPVASLRITQWRFAVNLIKERPLTGWGLRNFTPIYEKQMAFWLGHPHNVFLMLGAETGLPATLLLCGIVGWILAQGLLFWKKWPSDRLTLQETDGISNNRLIFFSYLVAFGCCILFNLTDVSLFDLRLNALGWLLLASIWGVTSYSQAQDEQISDRI